MDFSEKLFDNCIYMIKVVYACNDALFEGLYLSILSMLRRTNEIVSIFLLSADFTEINPRYKIMSDKHVIILNNLVKSFNFENSFTLINCHNEYYQHLKGNKNEKSHYSPYASLRLLIDLYPCFDDKVIYLDCDTMLAGNIVEFKKINLENNEFAVAHDCLGCIWQYKDCFNSGVIYFNMKEARKNNLFQKARKFLFKNFLYNSKSSSKV